MKKLVILLGLMLCLVFSGCSYSGAGLVQNSDGTVVEYYYIPFAEKEFALNGVSSTKISELLEDIKKEMDLNFFAKRMDDYYKRIEASEEYTLLQKEKLVSGVEYSSNISKHGELARGYLDVIQYKVTFANSTCYKEFKSANSQISEDKEVVTEKNLFTTTTRVVKDPIFECAFNETLTTGEYFINLVNTKMEEHFGLNFWNHIKTKLNYDEYSSKFNYSYVVPTSRIHSTANHVQRGNDGYYYHTWEIDLNDTNNNINIEYWTTTANKEVWYLTFLLISGIVAFGVYMFARKKEKEEIKSFDKQNNE